MTPTFCWVFLLALVGRATSMPQPLVVDACALLCNPGAETESEQARDPVLFPRYPKVNCKLQSDSEEHQAWVIASECFKLCNNELTTSLEVNCFALRSSLEAHLGCYCEALTPLSPNTMRLHESWRLNYLVKELASDILTVITDSPLDKLILCELHQEFFKSYQLTKTPNGKLESCFKNSTSKKEDEEAADSPSKRSVRESRSIKDSDFEQELETELLHDPIDTLREEIKDDKKKLTTEIPIGRDTITHTDTQIEEVNAEEIGEDLKIEKTIDAEEMPKKKRSAEDNKALQEFCNRCLEYCEHKDTETLYREFGETADAFNMFCDNCDIIKSKCDQFHMMTYKW